MESPLLRFGVGVVLLSLTPPTTAFSRGASRASCQEMTPVHIRAQPRDPQHSHISLRTSASSYLPGQLVTVTVRSSRDFMGFLLQARSVEGWGARARDGGAARLRSSRVGQVLVGGSWTFTPPGTHTLRCLSEGDTLTHSDKQLKRNLSFVWRAPDAPRGDIRFYITVVQSYFVHWSGIESAVVHDGSRSPWGGSTNVDRGRPISALYEDNVTPLPAPRVDSALNKRTRNATVAPAVTQRPSVPTRTGGLGYKAGETLREEVLPTESLLQDLLTNQAASGSGLATAGPVENATGVTDAYAASEFLSGVTDESGAVTGNDLAHTHDPKNLFYSSNHLTFLSTEDQEVKATRNSSPSPTYLPHLTDGKNERKEAKKDPQTTTTLPSTSHSFHSINHFLSITLNPTAPNKDQTSLSTLQMQSSSSPPWITNQSTSQTGVINGEMSSQQPHKPLAKLLLTFQTPAPKPSPWVKTFPFRPVLQSKTGTYTSPPPAPPSPSSPEPFSQSRTSTQNPLTSFKSPTSNLFLQSHKNPSNPLSSQPPPNTPPYQYRAAPVRDEFEPYSENRSKNSPPHSLRQSTAPHISPIQPPSLGSFNEALLQADPAKTQEQVSFPLRDQSQSDIPPEASGTAPQPWFYSQSVAPKLPTFEWMQSQPSATPRLFHTLLLTSTLDKTFTPGEGKENKGLHSPVMIKTISPIFVPVPSVIFVHSSPKTTPPPPSSSSFRFTTSPSLSGGSTSVSTGTSSWSTFFTRSSATSRRQPKTTPALSALPSPSPVSIPPRSPSVHKASTFQMPPSSTSAIKPPSTASNKIPTASFPLVPLTISSSSPLKSSQNIRELTFSPALSSYVVPAFPTSPPSSSGTILSSLDSSLSLLLSITSSASMSSQSTSPQPGPSSALRRSLYNLHPSSSPPSPSQKLIPSQTLLIQTHTASSDPEPNHKPSTPKPVVHPNPKPHPNLNPNFKLNIGHDFQPIAPKADTKNKIPSRPSATPDREGKYPEIIPRHSAWELGMLLGSSAGLGMVLVVGIRYMYRQACGKRTEVTLNDRERDYGRGERGLIHVQECGDLVRVRRIRENNLVLLAEYDILASPGD